MFEYTLTEMLMSSQYSEVPVLIKSDSPSCQTHGTLKCVNYNRSMALQYKHTCICLFYELPRMKTFSEQRVISERSKTFHLEVWHKWEINISNNGSDFTEIFVSSNLKPFHKGFYRKSYEMQ